MVTIYFEQSLQTFMRLEKLFWFCLTDPLILSDTSLLFFFFLLPTGFLYAIGLYLASYIFYLLCTFCFCTLYVLFGIICYAIGLYLFPIVLLFSSVFWSLMILFYRPIGPYLISVDFAFLLFPSLTYCPIGLYLLFLDFSVRIFLFSYLFCLSLFVSSLYPVFLVLSSTFLIFFKLFFTLFFIMISSEYFINSTFEVLCKIL